MKAKTKFEIVAVGILIIAIGYIAFSSRPQQVEAQRTVVIDGDLYRASNLSGAEQITNTKDIRMLFEEKNGLMIVGKGYEGGIPHTEQVGGTQLYLYSNDGTAKEKMVSEKSDVVSAIFDKNAENIFYYTIEDELYQYNIKSGENKKIAKEALPPRLSPDGKSLLYAKIPANWVLGGVDGGPTGFAILDLSTGIERKIPNTDSLYGSLQWTPDGKHIISSGLYIINIDGTELTQLTKHGDRTEAYGIGRDPLWSLDGRYFIYEFNGEIILVELDIPNKRVITAGPIAYGVAPRWVEEGKTISVFSPDAKAGAPMLSIVDLNGKVLQGDKSHEKEYYSSLKGAFRRVAPKPVPPPPPPEPPREIPPGVFHSIDATQSPDVPQRIPAGSLKPITQ